MKNTPKQLSILTEVTLARLKDYLEESQSGQPKVLLQQSPKKIAADLYLSSWIRNGGLNRDRLSEFLKTYFANSQHLHHPHFLGHQVAAPHISSGLADFIHGIINNPMALYEMGPAAAVIERVIIHWMLEKIGWFKGKGIDDFDTSFENGGGVLTNGGSLANLTAMAAARAKVAPQAWEEGNPADLVILAPSVSHYSVARAISILGIGQNAVIPIETGVNELMKPDALLPAFKRTIEMGQKVMAVVANACATSTGLYDPLDEIGDFCNQNNLWFHIDGAHGASALLSEEYKYLLSGVMKADSIVWDAHKMMQTSALCAAALFKDFKNIQGAFQQEGSYMFHDKEDIGFDSIPYAIECTKSALGTKLFFVLASEGEQGMGDFVKDCYDRTKLFHKIIEDHPDFYCPYVPESNILCFQHIRYSTDNSFQLEIRKVLLNRGNYYISTTEIKGIRYLRIVVMNSNTKKIHIMGMMNEIQEIALRLADGINHP